MKKRIISMAIVVVMIVAMIPAMFLSTSAIPYYDGYDGAMVNDGAITVDGSATPDEAYLAGEKIISRLHYGNKANSFEGYIAGDEGGFYLWIDVVDTTLDKANSVKVENVYDEELDDYVDKTVYTVGYNKGDRLQVYYRADSNKGSTAAGSLGFDYLGQLAIETIVGSANKSIVDFKTTTTETGWVAELYVPWGAIHSGFADFDTEDMTSFYIGVQCNDYTNDGNDKAQNYCYDSTKGGSYYVGMYGGSNHAFAADKQNNGWRGSKFVPVNFVGIHTAVVADALKVDGVMDAAYAKSEKIKSNTADGFYGYTVATVDGLYVFANLADETLDKPSGVTVDKGDKFQFYFQMGNRLSNMNWGYIEMDYTIDEATPNFRYVNKGANWYNNAPVQDNIEHAFAVSETGWTAELFIPWAGSVALDGFNQFTMGNVSVMLQFNDYTHTDKGDGTYSHSAIHYGLSNGFGSGAWYANNGSSGGPTGNVYFTPLIFNADPEVVYEYNRVAVYTDSITFDGIKDDSYTALAGDTVGVASGSGLDKLGNVYYAFTDTEMYIYIEVLDNTPTTVKTYEYACIYYEQSNWAGKWNLSSTGEFNNPGNYEVNDVDGNHAFVLYDGTNAATANLALTYVGEKATYTGYNIEFKMTLTEAEKAALAAGEAIQIGVGVEINNAQADGTRTHYGYSAGGGGYWYQTSLNLGYLSMPNVVLDKSNTEDALNVTPEIDSASVSLGESLAMNYYVTLPINAADYTMKFTFNEEETYVTGVATGAENEYVFTFNGIAPQCIGDNIKAELMLGDEIVDSVDSYSVYENCMNIIEEEPTNMGLIKLIADLGAYGAAAQVYANYKTDTLVNAGFESYATVVTEIDNDDKTNVGGVAGAAITAAGVYFDSTNRVYVKVTVDDFEAAALMTMTINGVTATAELTKVDNVFIFYTDELAVTEFDEVFTFVLSDGVDSQTVTYSVNAYCKAKLDAANSATAALAAATYAYGASAEAFIA